MNSLGKSVTAYSYALVALKRFLALIALREAYPSIGAVQ